MPDLCLKLESYEIELGAASFEMGSGAPVILSRFARALYTPIGTDPLFPQLGTAWLDTLSEASGDLDLLRDAAVSACAKAQQDLAFTQAMAQSPPDETLGSAVVDAVEIVGQDVVLTVRITDAVGTTATFRVQ